MTRSWSSITDRSSPAALPELKRRVGASYCQVTPTNPADLPQIAALAALASFDGIDIDADTNSVSVLAPDGVATLGEGVSLGRCAGRGLLDISLHKPSLDEVFLHLTEAPVAQS